MLITKTWLKWNGACKEAIVWFENQKERDSKKIIAALKLRNKYTWIEWLNMQNNDLEYINDRIDHLRKIRCIDALPMNVEERELRQIRRSMLKIPLLPAFKI